ncbi:MAG: hypothetical protein ACOH2N_19760 [Devosia sp.]
MLKPGYSINLRYFLSAGHPFEFALFSVANATGAPIVFVQVVTFCAILLGALALVSVVTRLRALSRLEALVCAVLVFAWPGYELWAGKGTASYVICLGLFFISVRLWLAMAEASKAAHAWRIMALAGFFVSFSLHSLMVLYVFALPAMLTLMPSRQQTGDRLEARVRTMARTMVLRYPDFVILPLLYWFLLGELFPRLGPYADYYHIRLLDLAAWLSGVNTFLRWAVIERLFQARTLLAHDRWLLLCSLGLSGIAGLLAGRHPALRPKGGSGYLLGAALLTFVALAVPYLLVETLPSAHFYESRHLLLYGVPAALAYVAIQRLADRFAGRWVALAFATVTMAVTVASTWQAHVFLQARWLQQLAMIHDLQRDWPVPPAMVYSLENGFADTGERNVYYGFFEVTGALHLVWQDQPFVGFTQRNERSSILQEIKGALGVTGSAVRNMQPDGPQATIILSPGEDNGSNRAMVLGYYQCLLAPGCSMDEIIDGFAITHLVTGKIKGVLEP